MLGHIFTHARVHWFQRHLRLTCPDWHAVLFTDESRFNLSKAEQESTVGEESVLQIAWNNITPHVI